MVARAKLFLLSALIWLSFFSSAFATVTITADWGGVIRAYLEKYDKIKQSGEKVIIDGICDSACTLVFMLPKNQVCITKNARLGFHQAYDLETKEIVPDSTAIIWNVYPQSVKTWIEEHGGLGREIKRMTAEDLKKVLRHCQN